jgi:hypothetical protein
VERLLECEDLPGGRGPIPFSSHMPISLTPLKPPRSSFLLEDARLFDPSSRLSRMFLVTGSEDVSRLLQAGVGFNPVLSSSRMAGVTFLGDEVGETAV